MTYGKTVAASLAMLLLLPATLVAEMYKYVDENGKVVYTDTPPPGKKSKKLDLKINTFSSPAVVSTIGNAAPQATAAAGSAQVKLYTTSWCGYCKQARAYLQARGTKFQDLDVETSQQGLAEYRALGGRGVPVILVGDQRMDGYSEGRLSGMLKQAGL